MTSYLNTTSDFEDSTDNLSLHTPSSQDMCTSDDLELDTITLEDLQHSPIYHTEAKQQMEQNSPLPTADEAGRDHLKTLLTLRTPWLAETIPNSTQMFTD